MFAQSQSSSTSKIDTNRRSEFGTNDTADYSSNPDWQREYGRAPTSTSPIQKLERSETIEDSDEEELLSFTRSGSERIRRRYDSEAPQDIQRTGSPENEIFLPTPGRSKRRRLSSKVADAAVRTRQPKVTEEESIDSSSSSKASPPCAANEYKPIEIPSRPGLDIFKQNFSLHNHEIPVAHARIRDSRTETPAVPSGGSSKTAFQNQPRFVLSTSTPTTKYHDGSDVSSIINIDPPTTPPRRKPNFILQHPSPNDNSLLDFESPPPAPFSPSSRTLQRRGRPRAMASNYKPGGNADEVRNWILEMAAKREQSRLTQRRNQSPNLAQPDKYLLTIKINDLAHGLLHSGPVTLIRGCVIDSYEDNSIVCSPTTFPAPLERFQPPKERNILLLGQPTSHSNSAVRRLSFSTDIPQASDVIGIFRGLTWEIELSQSDLNDPIHLENMDIISMDVDVVTRAGYHHEDRQKEKWLVAAEWDLIQ